VDLDMTQSQKRKGAITIITKIHSTKKAMIFINASQFLNLFALLTEALEASNEIFISIHALL